MHTIQLFSVVFNMNNTKKERILYNVSNNYTLFLKNDWTKEK